MKEISLVGYMVSDLDGIEKEAKAVIEKASEARKKMFDSAILNFVSNPTHEVKALDDALYSKLDDVLRKLKKPRGEIVLGSLYNLQQKFGDVNIAELLVSLGLFSKKLYYYSKWSHVQDHLFESEVGMEDCKEECEESGDTLYFDPIAGDQVSKEVFESNLYYTIVPTSLYLKIYSELLESYQNMKIY